MRLDPGLRPGLAFMTMHFPDEIDVNILTIDATDPKSGTAEFKATADPRGEGPRASNCRRDQHRGRQVAWTSGCSTPSRRRRSATPSTPSWAPRWRVGGTDAIDNGHAAHGGHAARSQRHLLLPTLHALHERVGWISPGGLNYVAERLTVPPADVYGVATFYALFSLDERPPRVVHVCDDIACRCAGSEALDRRARGALRPARTPRSTGALVAAQPVPGAVRPRARGAAHRRRATTPLERELVAVDAGTAWSTSSTGGTPPEPPSTDAAAGGDPSLRLLRARRPVDPESLDDYRAHGGYDALRRALELGPEGVIREVIDSKLVGRGGAAFPMGRKWDAVARQPRRPALPDLQRRRVRARDVQGPRAHGGRPVRRRRGDDHRRLRDRLRAGLPLHPRRVPARARSASRTRSRWPTSAASSGPTSSARASHSTSRCARAPAPTSAARRPRSSTRSRATAASRATSRRSRSWRGSSASPTVVNNVETLVNVLPIVLEGGPAFAADRHREVDRAQALLRVGRAWRRPGPTRSRSGPRCASCSSSPAGSAPNLQAMLLGGAAGGFVTPDDLDLRADHRGRARVGTTLGLGRRARHRRHRRPRAPAHGHRRLLPRRELRAVRALPRGHRAPGGGARAPAVGQDARQLQDELGAHRRDRPGDARRVDLRPRPDRLVRHRVRHRATGSASRLMPAAHASASRSTTSRSRCPRARRSSTPARSSGSTRRRSATARPAAGQRLPRVRGRGRGRRACWRRRARARSRPSMVVKTDSERVRHSRKMVHGVPRLVGRPVDHARARRTTSSATTRDPARYGPPAPPDAERDRRRTGHHEEPDGQTAATVRQPVKVDNDLYVRDYSKCILCYKCVDACGEQWQNTFAITVAGPRLRRAHLDRVRQPAARLGVRLLRQLHRRLPDRRADVRLRARAARGRRSGTRRARRRPRRSAPTAAWAAT